MAGNYNLGLVYFITAVSLKKIKLQNYAFKYQFAKIKFYFSVGPLPASTQQLEVC